MKLSEYAKTHSLATEEHWRAHFTENIRTGKGPVALYSCPVCKDILFGIDLTKCECTKEKDSE